MLPGLNSLADRRRGHLLMMMLLLLLLLLHLHVSSRSLRVPA